MKNRASLEHIFGSKVRVRILKLFLEHPNERFYVREITRCTRSHIHSVRRELSNLCRVGLIHVSQEDKGLALRKDGLRRKFYAVDSECIIFEELKSLFVKAQLFLREELKRQITFLGPIRYLALTGFFVDLAGFPTDMIIVGRISKRKCEKAMRDFEDEFGRTINYTILSAKEFMERKEMMDRFLYNFFENKKIVLVDKMPIGSQMGI